MNDIVPLILAGGSGTRLWPVSRKSFPKQFSPIFGEKTLFQTNALRLRTSETIFLQPPLTVTNSDFRFVVKEQLEQIDVELGTILIEPSGKNTGPAVLAGALVASSKYEDPVLLVAPSDHLIPDKNFFHELILKSLEEVDRNKIVMFGVEPTRPETGYGYLKLIEKKENTPNKIERFIEKPNLELAKKFVLSDLYLWNSGIFIFKAAEIIRSFKQLAPHVFKEAKRAVDNMYRDLDFFRLHERYWSKCPSISIDYAIMEKAQNILALPFNSKWSDLGDWESVWQQSIPDNEGMVVSHNSISYGCRDSLLRAEDRNQTIVGVGLENIVAVAMPDAVLIADKSRTQEVKQAVEYMKNKKIQQAESFPKDHRPWGWFETLIKGEGFQVKKIHVNPGGVLSLQSHKHRSEHWVVVDGHAEVTVDSDKKILTKGQSIYVPVGSVHRMKNPSAKPMILIEVQTGNYLGEDDIIRYEDIYARK